MVLHVAYASVARDPTGSRSAFSRDLTGCPTASLSPPAARLVDATVKIEAIAIPARQFRLFTGFIVDLFDFLSFVILS